MIITQGLIEALTLGDVFLILLIWLELDTRTKK